MISLSYHTLVFANSFNFYEANVNVDVNACGMQCRAGKNLGFLQKVFRLLDFLGFNV